VRRGYEGAKFKLSAKIFLSMRGGAFYGFLAYLWRESIRDEGG
jgi:hypothetical protein